VPHIALGKESVSGSDKEGALGREKSKEGGGADV